MKTKPKKIALTAAILLLFTIILLGALTDFFGKDSLNGSQTKPFSPHYLTYKGATSKIYLFSATSNYTLADQTYLSADGREVKKGTRLFTLNITLRNDYSNENPPPSTLTPVSPVDGTAYVCLNLALYSKEGKINPPNVSPSDFPVVPNSQTALILASGQTNVAELRFATNQTDITHFEFGMVFVGDSIPAA